MKQDEQLDITKLKYALYTRKSTDDSKNQVRSIDDQIQGCKEFSQHHGINISSPIIEKKSAKYPDKRPLFKQLLKDIKTKKYDGIVCWHPDRLARNMKEAGEIIDMLDENIIKDLKFVTHHFENTPSGKMLLGMSFVLSKHYTDNLSQNVTRGIRGNFMDGIALNRKHGYVAHEDTRFLVPDNHNNNFKLICDAWQLRKEGQSLESISDYLNANGYEKAMKTSDRVVKMTKQILTDVFKDPINYGILIQAKEKIDLRTFYDFKPTVSEEVFFEVQKLNSNRKLPYKKQKQANFNPFRRMIMCSFCKKYMFIAPSSGNKYDYLFARCDNKLCIRNSKENKKKDRNDPTKIKVSVRVKVVLDFVYKLLDKGLKFTEEDYKEYLKNFKILSENQITEITQEIHVKQGLLTKVKSELKNLSLSYIKLDDSKETIKKVTEEKISELEKEGEELEISIKKLKDKIANPKSEQLTIEEFLNLSKNAGTVVKSADAVLKDRICRFIFLNLSLNDKEIVSYRLKEPFKTLIETRDKKKESNSELGATKLELFEPLKQAIAEHWDFQDFDEEFFNRAVECDGFVDYFKY